MVGYLFTSGYLGGICTVHIRLNTCCYIIPYYNNNINTIYNIPYTYIPYI